MKIKAGLLSLFIVIAMLTGCGKGADIQKPEEEQIRAICELSTFECRYNNIAKVEKKKGEGLSHLFEKDRKYWIEYEGYVKLGIDMSKVSMQIETTEVTITIPETEIQEIGIVKGSYTEDSIIASEDGIINKNRITAEEQTQAIEDAQKKMEETMLANSSMMNKAQDRAKALIESYIENLGKITDVTYTVEWKKYE